MGTWGHCFKIYLNTLVTDMKFLLVYSKNFRKKGKIGININDPLVYSVSVSFTISSDWIFNGGPKASRHTYCTLTHPPFQLVHDQSFYDPFCSVTRVFRQVFCHHRRLARLDKVLRRKGYSRGTLNRESICHYCNYRLSEALSFSFCGCKRVVMLTFSTICTYHHY